jgi:hypothetical protein
VTRQKPVFATPLSPGLLAAGVLLAGFCPAAHSADARQTVTVTVAVSDSAISTATPNPGADSLRMEIERLKAEADKLRAEANAVNDSVKRLEFKMVVDRSPKKQGEPRKDTIEVLSKEGTEAFLATIRGKKRSARERGYGGGLGPTPGIYIVNMHPVRELLDAIAAGDDFRNIGFQIDGNREQFFLMGIAGYGALGSGLRIGGSFNGGSKSYSTRTADSTYTIELRAKFGGLLIEKAIVAGNFNWLLGGTIGGSALDVTPSKVSNQLSEASLSRQISEAIPRKYATVSAPGLLVELHGGFTYTMISWFHVGMDLSTPLFFSPSGFKSPGDQSITNGFITINPGLRIRIILGNIG